MPNHVTTKIFYKKKFDDKIAELMSKDNYGNDFFDFNKLIHIPKNDEEIKKKCPQYYIDDISKSHLCILDDDHKHFNWYDWSIKNWGTKWNSYYCEWNKEERIIKFDTTWTHPEPIIKAFARYIGVEENSKDIMVAYADEDTWGGNCGIYCPEIYTEQMDKDETPQDIFIANCIRYEESDLMDIFKEYCCGEERDD